MIVYSYEWLYDLRIQWYELESIGKYNIKYRFSLVFPLVIMLYLVVQHVNLANSTELVLLRLAYPTTIIMNVNLANST